MGWEEIFSAERRMFCFLLQKNQGYVSQRARGGGANRASIPRLRIPIFYMN